MTAGLHVHGRAHVGSAVDNPKSARLMRIAAFSAVGVAALLIAAKAVAYLMTSSVAILASLADSALDFFASLLNLVAIRHALMPADEEHRFGHGKAEPLAGLAQAAFIAGSSTFLVIESIGRFVDPRPLTFGGVGIGVMAFSLVATVALVWFQRSVVRRTGSIAIGADSLHYVGDILTNLGVMVGIVLATEFGILMADPFFGIAVAVVLAYGAWRVFRQSYDQLMDRELPDPERDRIKSIVMRHPEVVSLHDLRTRAAGTTAFIQFHIELDPAISLMRAHEVSDAVERDLMAAFPGAEIIIHQDPAGVEQPPAIAKS